MATEPTQTGVLRRPREAQPGTVTEGPIQRPPGRHRACPTALAVPSGTLKPRLTRPLVEGPAGLLSVLRNLMRQGRPKV